MKPDYRETILERYVKGSNYISEKGLVDKTKEQYRFYLGDQWYGLETGGEVMPMYNFIKPTVRYKISTICQNKMAVTYSDMNAKDENVEIFKAMNIKFSENWEKANMNDVCWKVVKGAAIAGDSYTFWYANHKCQLIDNTAVLLGDEQNHDIQEQPWIIIRERRFVTDIKEEAKANGVSQEEIDTITSDVDNDFQLNNNTDVDFGRDDGKCLSLIYMEKVDGVVWIGRTTMNCMYQPMKPMKYTRGGMYEGSGLSLYPIVNFVWEDQPDSARGHAEVREHIPNQIQINRLLAQRAIAVKQCAFPRLAYDINSVNNPEDLDTIGAAIELQGNTQAINTMVTYLNPAGLNGEGTALSNELLTTTRELAGASENILGQIDPTRVAATAIAALQEASAVNVNEQVSKFETYVEDTARLWWELDIVYNDMVTTEDTEGNPIVVTPDQMEMLTPDVRVDVSQDTAFTKESGLARMDKLLEMGQLTLEEWVQLLPQNSPLPKAELLKLMEQRKSNMMGQRQALAQEPPQAPEMPSGASETPWPEDMPYTQPVEAENELSEM